MNNETPSVPLPEQSYEVTIRQNRIKKNQVTALHLMIGFLLFLMGMVTWLVPAALKTERFDFLNLAGILYSGFGLLLLIVSVFFNRKVIQVPSRNQTLRAIEIIVLLSIFGYTLIQKWYLPMAYTAAALLAIVFAYFWEKNAQADRVIRMSREGVFVPGVFRSMAFQWQDIARVVLRHAVLTIDCHDNRLYQFDVKSILPKEASSELFHNYCKEMIEAHKALPHNDW